MKLNENLTFCLLVVERYLENYHTCIVCVLGEEGGVIYSTTCGTSRVQRVGVGWLLLKS